MYERATRGETEVEALPAPTVGSVPDEMMVMFTGFPVSLAPVGMEH